MMRVGLWSLTHLHALSYIPVLCDRPDVEFVGIADEEPERGRRIAQDHGVPFFASADELLARVEAIVITSANVDHCSMALRAAEVRVAALVEKPIATTLSDARAMVRAFESAGVILATAFPCPFSPAFEELVRVVRAGELGRVLAIKATNRGVMPGGFFTQLERSGGGAVMDHTVHVADLLRRLTGCEATQVYAEVGHGLYHQDGDDSGLLTIDLSDGSFATLDCSWSRPKSYPTWGDVTLHVVGERGNAMADLFSQHLHLYPADGSKSSWRGWGSSLDALMINDFITAVRESRPPCSSGVDGLKALEVTLAAYQSAKTAQAVRIEELA